MVGARHWAAAIVVALVLAGCGPGCPGNQPPAKVVPRFAYVVDARDAISSYAVDPSTGQLRHNGYALSPVTTAGTSVTSAVAPALVVNSSGFIHMIAGKSTTPTLVVAAIDSPTGILMPRSLTWGVAGSIPLDLVGHPSGRFVYVIDAAQNIQTASVDPSNGNLSPVGSPLSLGQVGSIQRVAVDPQGTYILAAGRGGAFPNYIEQIGAATIDQATSVPAGPWHRTQLPFQVGAVAIHPQGRCGIALPFTSTPQLATFSIAAGAVPTNAVGVTAAAGLIDAAFDPKGSAVFLLEGNGVSAYPITDVATCALGTKVGPVGLPVFGATRLSIDPSGAFLYATSSSANVIGILAIGAGPTLTPAGSATTRPTVTGFAPVFTSGTLPVSYLPTFLYVVNYKSNDISIFSISSSTGALSPAGTRTSLGSGPFAIAIDPWSRFAFVANRDSNTVAAFTINKSTGALSATVPAVAVGTKPVALAIDSSGRFLFVANNGSNNVQVFSINQSTGLLTASGAPVLAVGSQPTSMIVDPTGTTLYLSNLGGTFMLSGFTINQLIGGLGGTGASPSIAVSGYTAVGADVRGDLVFAGDTASNLVTTFPVNTALANLASPTGVSASAGRQPVSVAVDPLGRFVYTANNIDASISVYSVNRSGSTLTPGTGVNLGLLPPKVPRAAIVDPSGQFLYVADEMGQIFSFTINATTGALTGTGSVSAGNGPFALGVARLPI